jgi:hypothetical protein
MLKIKLLSKRIATIVAVGAMLFGVLPTNAFAAQITGRTLTIGNSNQSAVTTYNFTFTVPTTTAVESASFTLCTTASGTCTTPAGFSNTGVTLTAPPTGLGLTTGWTVDNTTAGSLRLKNASNTTLSSGSQTVGFTGVTNPSTANATFFARITTYATATYTTPIDTGNVAASTAGQVTVTANVDEALTFTLAAATVALGTLTTSSTGSGSTSMTASTNAATGYSITYTGTTLTSAANTITANSAAASSTQNSKQFGFNLVANTTPAIGTGVTGTGTATAATGYNTANQFKFNSGDTIASVAVPTNSNTYTASYIANIDGITPPGAYSTVLTYVATANF